MKYAFKYILAVLVAATCVSSGCKKAVTDDLTAADLSRQMAVSLYKSLSGQYGGADISDGIKAPLSLSKGHQKVRINTINPYCGLVIDTTYNFSEVVADTLKGYFGHYRFTYVCTNNVLDSYTLDDSIANTVNKDLYSAIYKLTQKYFVKAIDPTYKLSSVEGTISFSSHASLLNKAKTSSQYQNSDIFYTLNGVRVDISSGVADVIQGEAAFTARINNKNANTVIDNNFYGTITFFGNKMAHVLIHLNNDTKLYTVNMVSGQVTSG
jgi:hypothetical protein